jgi:hypothetical protein
MRILTVWLSLSAIRIAALWILIYFEWTHRQSIALAPLVILLYPEGLLLPSRFTWTAWGAVGFSGVLLVGSFVLTMVFFVAMRALKS